MASKNEKGAATLQPKVSDGLLAVVDGTLGNVLEHMRVNDSDSQDVATQKVHTMYRELEDNMVTIVTECHRMMCRRTMLALEMHREMQILKSELREANGYAKKLTTQKKDERTKRGADKETQTL
ncbi:hypothetical protein L596_009223 [Steinernema carpocapsae]|uniref:Uncharacterized protein n=1 Tax=Steinernema carpocapsae TaxID=34508 RepID=A0A4U5PEX1_STECR|nr:hypothetical protein L596_009140 [Steinernema carpocapsae]TKR94998.1 hypothetical protein L596_009223 [Steinernema carpocapsae]